MRNHQLLTNFFNRSAGCWIVLLAFLAVASAEANQAIFTEDAISVLKSRQRSDVNTANLLKQAVGLARGGETRETIAKGSLSIEGHLGSVDATQFHDDMLYLVAFGFDYALTRYQPSLNQAKHYLLAWAGNYTPTGNPINEEGFFQYIAAYDLIYNDLDAPSKKTIDNFLAKLFAMEKQFVAAKIGFTEHNNWESRHLGLVTAIAFSLNDPAMIKYCEDKYKELIQFNILPAGTLTQLFPNMIQLINSLGMLDGYFEKGVTLDFIQRDALEYHVASITGLLVTDLLVKRHSFNWYPYQAPKGQSLSDGLNFIIPYATGAKTHEEFVKSIVSFDRDNHRGGEFEAKKGQILLTLAAAIDPKYAPYANSQVLEPFYKLFYYSFKTSP